MKKQRPRRVPWRWTGTGLVFQDEDEQLWLCPELPAAAARISYPLALHVSYWSSDLPMYACMPPLDAALYALWSHFGRDSVLAAIRRREPCNDVLLYTAAPRGIAIRRYDDIYRALRPPSMNIGYALEPTWETLESWLSSGASKQSTSRGAAR